MPRYLDERKRVAGRGGHEVAGVKYPGFSRDIISFGLVQDMALEGTELKLKLKITTPDPAVPEKIGKEIRDALKGYGPIKSVTIETEVAPPQATATTGAQGIEGVKRLWLLPVVRVVWGSRRLRRI